jgi:hypothetical protein
MHNLQVKVAREALHLTNQAMQSKRSNARRMPADAVLNDDSLSCVGHIVDWHIFRQAVGQGRTVRSWLRRDQMNRVSGVGLQAGRSQRRLHMARDISLEARLAGDHWDKVTDLHGTPERVRRSRHTEFRPGRFGADGVISFFSLQICSR